MEISDIDSVNQKAREQLGLESLIELKDPPEDLRFTGLDLVSISYEASVRCSDCYLLRDDPYSVEPGEMKHARLRRKTIPEGSTHYLLGPKLHSERISMGKNRRGSFQDHYPIAFFTEEHNKT